MAYNIIYALLAICFLLLILRMVGLIALPIMWLGVPFGLLILILIILAVSSRNV